MGRIIRNPFAMALVGILLGLLGGVVLGALVLLLLNSKPAELRPAPSPPTFDVEAVAEEDYINWIMVKSANDMGGPVSLAAGKMDLRPGAVADFAVVPEFGPLKPVVEGTVCFVPSEDGSSIEVRLLDVNLGRLHLNRLVPRGALDGINADIKRLIVDKVGSQGLSVLAVGSDDNTLWIRLGRKDD